MESSKRPLILGGILAAVLAFGAGRPMFMQPLLDAQRDLTDAKSDLEDAEADDFQLQLARTRVNNAIAASLPPDVNDAQRLYLQWVTDLIQECNFAQATATPAPSRGRSRDFRLVAVNVSGECSLRNLSRFLFRFRQADLMHRLTILKVVSTATAGKPRMEIELTAEAMSIPGAADRQELVPGTKLTDPLAAEESFVKVSDPKLVARTPPFLAVVNQETIRVTEVTDDGWQIERACIGSTAVEHPEGSVVRHVAVRPDGAERQFADYQAFLDQPPFVKPPVPREYNPELAGVEDVTVEPGDTASLSVRVDDFNVDIGEITFALRDAPEFISIDPRTGQISWETAEDQEPVEHRFTVTATQLNNTELSMEATLSFIVRLPNEAPVMQAPEKVVVYLGRSFELQLSATDDNDVAKLTWALDGEDNPEGLTLAEDTGLLTWQPAATDTPGTKKISVTVTDQGDPQQSVTQEIALEIQDDDAMYTELSGTVTADGKREAWFSNKRTKDELKLFVNDRLKVADIDAEIVLIEARLVKLRDDQGTWLLAIGNKARDRVLEQKTSSAE